MNICIVCGKQISYTWACDSSNLEYKDKGDCWDLMKDTIDVYDLILITKNIPEYIPRTQWYRYLKEKKKNE